MSDKNVNKVVFGDETIMDISDSTVTEGSLLKGTTAYSADGSKIVGTMEGGADLDLSVVDGKLNQTYGDEEGTETTSPIALNSSLESANQKLDAIANAIQTVSGGGSYTLPVASADTLGGVKVNGNNLSIDSNGVIKNTYSYTLPTASSSTLGGVKVGDGLTISSGTLSLTKEYKFAYFSYNAGSKNYYARNEYSLIIPYSTLKTLHTDFDKARFVSIECSGSPILVTSIYFSSNSDLGSYNTMTLNLFNVTDSTITTGAATFYFRALYYIP